MFYKGMNYDVGWNDGSAEEPAVSEWNRASARREMAAIADDLHCNAVNIMGTDVGQLVESATVARERGLHVWVQPRLVDNPPERTREHLSEAAEALEKVRERYGDLTLNIGCELTLLMGGIAPGETIFDRIETFTSDAAKNMPEWVRQLDEYLAGARAAVRSRFGGPVTYAAGDWESVGIDWSDFDLINIDHYLTEENEADYTKPLRALRRHGKPVVVGEFGCCTFEGAEKLGGMGWDVVDHFNPVPQLKGDYVRSEKVQAEYAIRVLEMLDAEGVHGAFWYHFMERNSPPSPDPRFDLDMAGYGVVTAFPNDPEDPEAPRRWEPKEVFHAIADYYRTH